MAKCQKSGVENNNISFDKPPDNPEYVAKATEKVRKQEHTRVGNKKEKPDKEQTTE